MLSITVVEDPEIADRGQQTWWLRGHMVPLALRIRYCRCWVIYNWYFFKNSIYSLFPFYFLQIYNNSLHELLVIIYIIVRSTLVERVWNLALPVHGRGYIEISREPISISPHILFNLDSNSQMIFFSHSKNTIKYNQNGFRCIQIYNFWPISTPIDKILPTWTQGNLYPDTTSAPEFRGFPWRGCRGSTLGSGALGCRSPGTRAQRIRFPTRWRRRASTGSPRHLAHERSSVIILNK